MEAQRAQRARRRNSVLAAIAVASLVVGAVLARVNGDDDDVNATDVTATTSSTPSTTSPTSTDAPRRTTTSATRATSATSTTAGPGQSTSTTSTSTTPRSTASTSTASTQPSIDGTAILLELDDLPDGWSRGAASFSEIGADEAFCGEFVDTDGLGSFDVSAFQAARNGPFAVSAAAVFADGGDADDYLDLIARSIRCQTWVDDNGFTNTIKPITSGTDAARSDGYRQTVDTGDFVFVSDTAYLRSGRAVAIVSHVAVDRTDPDLTGELWNRQADKMIAVVNGR